jgi:hypothetical protein
MILAIVGRRPAARAQPARIIRAALRNSARISAASGRFRRADDNRAITASTAARTLPAFAAQVNDSWVAGCRSQSKTTLPFIR